MSEKLKVCLEWPALEVLSNSQRYARRTAAFVSLQIANSMDLIDPEANPHVPRLTVMEYLSEAREFILGCATVLLAEGRPVLLIRHVQTGKLPPEFQKFVAEHHGLFAYAEYAAYDGVVSAIRSAIERHGLAMKEVPAAPPVPPPAAAAAATA